MRTTLRSIITALCLALMCPSIQADDNTIAHEISTQLERKKQETALQGFRIQMTVEDGTVFMSGHVASTAQRDLALDIARRAAGVKLVVNDLKITGDSTSSSGQPAAAPVSWQAGPSDPAAHSTLTNPASRFREVPASPLSPDPQPVGAYQRVAGYSPVMAPPVQPMAQPMPAGMGRQGPPIRMAQAVGCAAGDCGGSSYGGTSYGGGTYGGEVYGGNEYGAPAAEYGGSYGTAPGGISHEQPQLPGYAWPSYASYPNYGALTYPRQYSPQAWPYIGPFYPYPQVPLGWRKVTLEWDDGWWMLDFAAK